MEETPHGDPAPASGTVGVADAQVAADIARAIRRGKQADRTPTLEQLLAAFGELVPTHAARERARRALTLAGIQSRPDVLEAQAGQRLLLSLSGSAAPSGRRAVLGLAAIGLVIVVAAVAAAVAGTGGSKVNDTLPPESIVGGGSTTLTDLGSATTTSPKPATKTAPTTTTTAPAQATTTAPATTTTTPAAGASSPAGVTVRVDASAAPTYLCVEDGAGKQLYAGTLDGKETFRAPRVKLNIGLGSTVVTVGGKRVELDGSPAGLDVTPSGSKPLALGERPCG